MEMRGDTNELREADGDSDAVAHRDHKSESEEDDAQPVESDEEESAVKRTVGGSDDEDEPPVNQEEGGASSAGGRARSSDEEEANQRAADSDSELGENQPGSPDPRSTAGSVPQTPARPAGALRDSEEEQEPAGAPGSRWKAVVPSDSEEDTKMRKISTESDEEQQEDEEEHRSASDEGQPGRPQQLVSPSQQLSPWLPGDHPVDLLGLLSRLLRLCLTPLSCLPVCAVKRKKAILSDSEDEEQLDRAGESWCWCWSWCWSWCYW